jgi:hypothetical protein
VTLCQYPVVYLPCPSPNQFAISLAYRSGVTSAISSWSWTDVVGPNPGTFAGISVAFRTGAAHGLEKGAVLKAHAALHVIIGHNGGTSVSTQVAAVRSALLGNGTGTTKEFFVKAAEVRR